jgi:uncharacterized protein YndB with AHSA1/START domain
MTTPASTSAVESGIDIAAPPEVVFDHVTDVVHEPEWNAQMSDVENSPTGPPVSARGSASGSAAAWDRP